MAKIFLVVPDAPIEDVAELSAKLSELGATRLGLLLRDLRMPDFRNYAVEVKQPGATEAEATRVMGKFLRDVMKLNLESKNFRLFSPDENNSNRWQDVLELLDLDDRVAARQDGQAAAAAQRPRHRGDRKGRVFAQPDVPRRGAVRHRYRSLRCWRR